MLSPEQFCDRREDKDSSPARSGNNNVKCPEGKYQGSASLGRGTTDYLQAEDSQYEVHCSNKYCHTNKKAENIMFKCKV